MTRDYSPCADAFAGLFLCLAGLCCAAPPLTLWVNCGRPHSIKALLAIAADRIVAVAKGSSLWLTALSAERTGWALSACQLREVLTRDHLQATSLVAFCVGE
jgi:hypothetical protein